MTVALLELPTGGLADTIGRRTVYLVSRAFAISAAVVLAFAQTPVVFAGGFALVGAARALSSGSMDAYFVDAFESLPTSGELQRFLARVGIFAPLSLAISGFLGGLIPAWAASIVEPALSLDRYTVLFGVVFVVDTLQSVLTVLLVATDSPREARDALGRAVGRIPAVFRESIRVGIADRTVLFLLLGSAAWGVAFAGLEQFWQPFVDGLTIEESPTRLFGYLTTGYFAVGSVGALAANWLFRVIGPRHGIAVGVSRVIIGGLFLLLSLSSSVSGFAVFYLALFFLNGINDSPEQALFNDSIPSSARSTLLSFQSLFLQLGGGVAALAWGVVSERISIAFSWTIAGLIFGLSGVLFITIRNTGRSL